MTFVYSPALLLGHLVGLLEHRQWHAEPGDQLPHVNVSLGGSKHHGLPRAGAEAATGAGTSVGNAARC